MASKGQRASVSAEVYGLFNKKEEFKAKVIAKNNEQKIRISNRNSLTYYTEDYIAEMNK